MRWWGKQGSQNDKDLRKTKVQADRVSDKNISKVDRMYKNLELRAWFDQETKGIMLKCVEWVKSW